MAIQSLQFLQATNPYHGKVQAPASHGYHQGTQQTSIKTATQGFKPSVEDYEKAQAYIDGNYNAGNIFAPQKASAANEKGAAFDGFTVPANNGTGELSPVYEPGERLLDFKC